MKEETRKGFVTALETYKAKDHHEKEERERKLNERQQFEAQWRSNRDNVVLPALQKIATEMLRPNGWECQIRAADQGLKRYDGSLEGSHVERRHWQTHD